MKNNEKIMGKLQNDLDRYKKKMERLTHSISSNSKYSRDRKISAGLESIEASFQKASDVYESLKTATADKWEDMKTTCVDLFEEAKDAYEDFSSHVGEDLFHNLKDKVEDVKDEALDYGKDLFDNLQNKIEKHPFSSALWGIGLGFLVGRLMKCSK